MARILRGPEAIRYAEETEGTLNRYADANAGATAGLSIEEARAVMEGGDPNLIWTEATDVSVLSTMFRDTLDTLIERRRAAEDAAAALHGVDIDTFFGGFDERVYHDTKVVSIQAEIDTVLGRD